MKLDKNTLAQMIKEELEVILTDEEAVEMFGLENMVQETAHYDMQLADGTVLENIAFEDIQVTNASLAEGHEGHTAKRDDDEDEDVDKNTGTRTEKPKGKFKTSYGHMKENNLFMTRDKLAEMVREEMARTTERYLVFWDNSSPMGEARSWVYGEEQISLT